MANSINKAILVGYLGKDPEIRYTASGQAMLKFSLATSKSYKDKGGDWKDETTWHNITVWGKLAENLHQRLAKGSRVYIEGSISNRSYEKDGRKAYFSEIIPFQVVDLSPKQKDSFGGEGDGGATDGGSADGQQSFDGHADDVPF